MKKQTAVDQLIEKIEKCEISVDHVNRKINIHLTYEYWMEMKKQTKQLERQQIEEAWNNAKHESLTGWTQGIIVNGSDYFTQTYKQ